jgi:hypothetical protein
MEAAGRLLGRFAFVQRVFTKRCTRQRILARTANKKTDADFSASASRLLAKRRKKANSLLV